MNSNCIMIAREGKLVAFPFASPGPHADTIERFRKEVWADAYEAGMNYTRFKGEVVNLLGFKGAVVREGLE